MGLTYNGADEPESGVIDPIKLCVRLETVIALVRQTRAVVVQTLVPLRDVHVEVAVDLETVV